MPRRRSEYRMLHQARRWRFRVHARQTGRTANAAKSPVVRLTTVKMPSVLRGRYDDPASVPHPSTAMPNATRFGWSQMRESPFDRLIGIGRRAMHEMDTVVHGDADEREDAERAEEIEREMGDGEEPGAPDQSEHGRQQGKRAEHTSRTMIQTSRNTATTPSNRPRVRSCWTRPEISRSTTRSPVTTSSGPAARAAAMSAAVSAGVRGDA